MTTNTSSSTRSAAATLSALAPAMSMVPASVRRRATAPSTTDAAAAESAVQVATAGRHTRPRPRPRRQKQVTPRVSIDTIETQPPPPLETSASAAMPAANGAQDAGGVSQRKNRKRRTKKSRAVSTALQAADTREEGGGEVGGEKEAEQTGSVCLLCTDAIEFYAVGACNHHGICSKCSMRMRLLMDDYHCPMCKQRLGRVIVSRSMRSYESFELWGDAAGPDSVLDEQSEIVFVDCRAHYNDLCRLRGFQCRIKRCREVKHSLGQLKEHLRRDHSVEFCELCLTHQSFFIQEQEVFSKGALKGHSIGRSRGASAGQQHANTGKDFHPMCQFCRKRFYGDKELYEHLERDHFKCHICKVENEYFRNYASLETHFRREHHLCEDSRCLEMRFVVFPNNVDYHAHMSSIHGVHNRLQCNFQVARGGGNQASAPVSSDYTVDRLPDHWSYGGSDHPPPLPAVRLEEAFPALPAPAGPAPPPVWRPAIVRPSSARTQGPPTASQRAPAPPRGQIFRNQNLAQALGVTRPGLTSGDAAAFEEEMKSPSYPEELVAWGKANTSYLAVVERRLKRIVEESSCHSVSLRAMSGEERASMHQLATFYGVESESFGEDPRRRVSFFKRENAQVPGVTLSAYISNLNKQVAAARAASRLRYLPLQSSATQAPAPVPARHPVAVDRGWERIAPRCSPAIRDAWSDDDADGGTDEEGSADSSGFQEQNEGYESRPLGEQTSVGV